MRKLGVCAAVAAATLLAAGPASALVYTVTYDGTVAYGADQTGVFGTAGADLVGQDFRIVFTVDTAHPGSSYEQDEDEVLVYGLDAASPLSALVTIGGHTIDVADYLGLVPGYSGSDYRYDLSLDPASGSARTFFAHSLGLQTDDGSIFRQVGAFGYALDETGQAFGGNQLGVVPNLTAADLTDYLGTFLLLDYTVEANQVTEYRLNTFALMDLRAISSKAVSAAVPEPAAWGLMIVGFGVAGAGLRRRRAAVA